MTRFARRLSLLPLWLAVCLAGLAACVPAPAVPEIYRPPTAPASPSGAEPAGGGFSQPAAPAPAPVCTDGLRFLEDLTIPDGTIVQPGEQVDKQWLVQNDGACNWDSRYRLRLVSGPSMGAAAEQALYPARGGAQAVIRILFTAPLEPGAYQSAWQAYNPEGLPFGEAVFVEIIVH